MLAVNRSTGVHAYRDPGIARLIEQRVRFGSRKPGVAAARSAVVPWWVTLPTSRMGQFPAVLAELAAVEHGDPIAFVHGVLPAQPSPLDDLARSFARVGGNVNSAPDPTPPRVARNAERSIYFSSFSKRITPSLR